jgi:hypothetical protein
VQALSTGNYVTTRIIRSLRQKRLLFSMGAAVFVSLCCSAPPAFAGTDGTNSATLNVAPPPVVSITVSPVDSTFGNCTGGTSSAQLSIPNGTCYVGQFQGTVVEGGITITNGTAPAQIDVNGAAAAPSDGGTGWSLSTNGPGTNAYVEGIESSASQMPTLIGTTPACDNAFGDMGGLGCSASPGQSASEILVLDAPSSSTATASSFTITTTWTAVSS